MKQIQGRVNNSTADLIIAVSPAAAENLRETGVDMSKVRIIFNGTDALEPVTQTEKEEALKLFGVKEGEFVCTILARLTPVKGHEFFIEAARSLQNENIRFLIAGTGEIENELKESAKDLDNVTFLGFTNKVRELLGITDIQINAAYGTETTSLALLEGMSLGVPAIVSDFGGNPYVIENGVNGAVIKKKDAQALTEAILKMKNDPEGLKVMFETTKERFSRFTAKRMSGEVDEVYLEVLKKYNV